jgi:hypothetical protein
MVATNFSTLTDGFQFLSLFDQAFAQCLSQVQTRHTGAYAVLPTDSGTIILGGNALYTLTVNVASGYSSNFAVAIYNEDAGRGKNIAVNGLSSFILWPKQLVVIFNDNNAWKLSPNKQPWIIPAGTTFNVDNVNGSDASTNDGLGAQGTGGAFLTIGHAILTIQAQAAFGSGAEIQLPPTTSSPITEQVAISGTTPEGTTTIPIVGNPTTPTNCQWQAVSGTAITIDDYLGITLNGIGFSGSGFSFVAAAQFALVDFQNCDFGTNTNGVDITASENTRMNFLSGCSISGNASTLLSALSNSSISMGSALTINNAPAFNSSLIQANSGAIIDVTGLSFTGPGAGSIIGTRYIVRNGSIIFGDSGVSWPVGLTSGTAIKGGLSDVGASVVGSVTFANLPGLPQLGTILAITDSTTNTWGATVSTGGGTITVLSWFNNSVWTVLGK